MKYCKLIYNFATKFTCLCLLFTMVMISSDAFSQTAEDNLKNADETFAKGDFYNASVYYKQILDNDTTNCDIAYKYANSCRLYNNYIDAEKWYLYIINRNNRNYPLAAFYYAEMNKYNGKYELAIASYKDFYNKNKDKIDFYSQKAKQEIASTEFAIKLMKDTVKTEIT
ncbi:MAG: hypothetical protein WCL51_14095, partial [Bacteroidota bacterium]